MLLRTGPVVSPELPPQLGCPASFEPAREPPRVLWHAHVRTQEADIPRTGGVMTQPITMQIFSDYV